MYLEVQRNGRVFLRRDLSKYFVRFTTDHRGRVHAETHYDLRPSSREREDSTRLIDMIRAVFRGKEAA